MNQVIEDENRLRIKHRLFIFCVGKTLDGGESPIVFSTYFLLNLEYFGYNVMGAPGQGSTDRKADRSGPRTKKNLKPRTSEIKNRGPREPE